LLFPNWARLNYEQATGFCACIHSEGAGLVVNIDRYDPLFSTVLDRADPLRMAVVQLSQPAFLTTGRLALYLDFLRNHIEAAMSLCVEHHDLAALELLLEHHLLDTAQADRLLEMALASQQAELVMALLSARPAQTDDPAAPEIRYEL
jgi:hypothetical protein